MRSLQPTATDKGNLDRTEKAYTCAYCPLSSSRKDAIIRHTRNFHPDQVRNSWDDEQADHNDIDDNTRQAEASSRDSDLPVGSTAVIQPAAIAINRSNNSQPSPQMPLTPLPERSSSLDQSYWLHFDPATALDLNVQSHEDLPMPANEDFAPPLSHDGDQACVPDFFGYSNSIPWDHFVGNVEELHDEGNIRHTLTHRPEITTPLSDLSRGKPQSHFGITDDTYSKAKTDLSLINDVEKMTDVHFPPKPSMLRFVRAFFAHMAPFVPIVHKPTFDISMVPRSSTPPCYHGLRFPADRIPALLLLEVMACGAVYANESQVGASLHWYVLELLMKVSVCLVVSPIRYSRSKLAWQTGLRCLC